jgi:hypothetical protein
VENVKNNCIRLHVQPIAYPSQHNESISGDESTIQKVKLAKGHVIANPLVCNIGVHEIRNKEFKGQSYNYTFWSKFDYFSYMHPQYVL